MSASIFFSFSFIYFIVSIFFIGTFSVTESKTYWGDIAALKELKQAITPSSIIPGSCISSWDFSFDPCDSVFSQHFTCGLRCDVVVAGTSRVTELTLDSAGYSGSLSSLAFNLPYLQILDLSNNFFSGSIPSSLSNLAQLQHVGLSKNLFAGNIPASLSSLNNLQELYLDNNKLQGTIPSTFKGLASLRKLELQGNKFTGKFPDLGSLQNLKFLDASDNSISGELPANFPASLLQISFRNNYIQGTIPENIQSLNILQVMDLSHNKFSGSVPYFLFNHPSLQQINLSNNSFTSLQVPANFGTQSELIALDLSNNLLQGLLPVFLGFMPKLSALSLENNKFTGFIPVQYALKTVLPGSGVMPFQRLLLGRNYLFGPIPIPLLGLKPGSAMVNLANNCLFRCPLRYFFCQGGQQKSSTQCQGFNPGRHH